MGLPLVTLNGDNLRTRQSTSALAHLGRHEWIARNQEEYLQIAMELAADIPALNQLRQGLRQEVEASVVMREDVFAQEVWECTAPHVAVLAGAINPSRLDHSTS